MQYTLHDAYDFCLANKRARAFPRFTSEAIGWAIIRAHQAGTLVVATDNHGICGVGIYELEPRRVYIKQVVAVRQGLRAMLAELQRRTELPIYGFRKTHVKRFKERILWAILLLPAMFPLLGILPIR